MEEFIYKLFTYFFKKKNIYKKINIYYKIQHIINVDINNKIPNYKLRDSMQFSFLKFIKENLHYGSMIDFGANNDYLAKRLLADKQVSTVTCVDPIIQNGKYKDILNYNGTIEEYIKNNKDNKFTTANFSGILSLLPRNSLQEIFDWCSKNVEYIFIREVPLITTQIDHYAFENKIERTYNNFTQSELLSVLATTGFTIQKFEREYDMFLFLRNNNITSATIAI